MGSAPNFSGPVIGAGTDRSLYCWKQDEREVTFRSGLEGADFSGTIVELSSQPSPWLAARTTSFGAGGGPLLSIVNLRCYGFQLTDNREVPNRRGLSPKESSLSLRDFLSGYTDNELTVCTPRGNIYGALVLVLGGPGTVFVLVEPKARRNVWFINFDNCLRIMLPRNNEISNRSEPSSMVLGDALKPLRNRDCIAHTTFDDCCGRFGFVAADTSNLGPKLLFGSMPQLTRNLGMLLPWNIIHALEFRLANPVTFKDGAAKATSDDGGDGEGFSEVPAWLDPGPSPDVAHAAATADEEDDVERGD